MLRHTETQPTQRWAGSPGWPQHGEHLTSRTQPRRSWEQGCSTATAKHGMCQAQGPPRLLSQERRRQAQRGSRGVSPGHHPPAAGVGGPSRRQAHLHHSSGFRREIKGRDPWGKGWGSQGRLIRAIKVNSRFQGPEMSHHEAAAILLTSLSLLQLSYK